jgi:hypothetical protein
MLTLVCKSARRRCSWQNDVLQQAFSCDQSAMESAKPQININAFSAIEHHWHFKYKQNSTTHTPAVIAAPLLLLVLLQGSRPCCPAW